MESAKKKNLVLFFVLYIAYSAIYIARLNFSVASVLFQDGGILTKAQIGIIGSIFSLAYAATKIPGGYIGDRVPSRPLIIFGLALAGISNLIIGFFPNFITLVIFWLLNSAGQALLWGPVLRTVTEYYGLERSKTLNQYLVSSTAFGSVLGLLITGFLSDSFGLKSCFIIPGIITLFMIIPILVFVKNDAPEKRNEKMGNAPVEKVKSLTLRELLRDKRFLLMFLPALGHGLIKDNLNVWLPSFFADLYGIDLKSIALYVFFIPAMALIGRFLYPLFAKLFHEKHRRVTAFGFIVATLCLIPLLFFKVPPIVAVVLLGLVSAMISLCNTYILSLFPAFYAKVWGVSLVSGLMDVFTYGGAGIGSLFFGVLIEKFGYGSMFIIWIIACLLSVIALGFMKKPKRVKA